MKRIISITIALCLVFASVLPVYAEAWTSTQATSVTDDVHALITAFTGSVGTMYNSISELMSWLTPVGSFSSSHSITGVTLYEIVDYIAWTLSGVGPTVYQTFQDIATSITNSESFISSWMTSNNSYLSNVVNRLATTSYPQYYQNQGQFVQEEYGSTGFESHLWSVANVPILGAIWIATRSTASSLGYGFSRLLTGFDSTLSTWEHSTNTQTSFTPTSLANGLYRYLAYIQSDTAQSYYKLFNNGLQSFNIYRYGVSSGSRFPVTEQFTPASLLNAIMTLASKSTYDNAMLYQHLIRLTNNSASSNYLGVLWASDMSNISPHGKYNVVSMLDLIARGFQNLSEPLYRLAYVHADDDSIELKNDTSSVTHAVSDDYLKPNGSAAVSAAQFGDVATASGNLKTNFNTGVSSSGVWDIFSSNHYNWFTQDTANSLDTVQAQTRGSYNTPLLDNYYHEIMDVINIDYNPFEYDNSGYEITRKVIDDQVIDDIEDER